MGTFAPQAPLRFYPYAEQRGEEEARTEAALSKTMRGIQETTFRDYGHALRSVHT